TLLPPALRHHASAAQLCYFRLAECAPQADRLFVRVSALPHRLDETNGPRVFTVCLTTEQIAQALLWDRTLQGLPTCEVRELVALHAQQVVGTSLALASPLARAVTAPSAPVAAETEEDLPPAGTQEGLSLVPLPEVFVSCETVQRVVA